MVYSNLNSFNKKFKLYHYTTKLLAYICEQFVRTLCKQIQSKRIKFFLYIRVLYKLTLFYEKYFKILFFNILNASLLLPLVL